MINEKINGNKPILFRARDKPKKKLDWNSTTTKKHIKEAKAVGLTLIGPGRNTDHRSYRFNDCGHERDIHTVRVRRNSFKCNQCLQKKLESEAKAVGLTLIGPGRNTDHRSYRFNDCGHERDIHTVQVRRNCFRCNPCLQKKLESEAKAVGLTLIGPGRNCLYRTYRLNKCNHEQEILTGCVRDNRFMCDQCFQVQLESEAKAVGLTLIGPGRNASHRSYRFNDCKHNKEITTANVRCNSFICETCEETSLDLPSKVYLLRVKHKDFCCLKLGHSKKISTRIKGFGLIDNVEVERLKFIHFDTGREADVYEDKLHKRYKKSKVSKTKMKKYFTRAGFSECYPLKMLDTLMDELDKENYYD